MANNTQKVNQSVYITDLDFQPNILDSYDNSTYHFKFFMVSTNDSINGNVFDRERQVIIAESGITDILIDDVSIETINTIGPGNSTGTSTQVRFTLIEPGGANLFDKIYLSSIQLGIGNWTKTPFYLELSFKGRTFEDSSPIVSDALGSQRWLWKLFITDVKTNVTHAGAVYTVSAILYDELAQSDNYSKLLHNIVIDDVSTVGEVIEKLQRKINFDQYEKILSGYQVPDSYEFVVDPKIASMSIVKGDEQQQSQRSNSYVELTTKSVILNQGYGIDKIIDSLMSVTNEYQKSTKNSSTPDDNDSKNKKDKTKKFWRLYTVTKPKRIDPGKQDEARHITYYIVPIDKGNIRATMEDTVDNEENTKAKFQEYRRKGMIKKRYDYIFTGLNDQIIDFDITLNFGYFVALPVLGGIYTQTASSDPGRKHHRFLKEREEAKRKIIEQLQIIANPQNQDDPARIQEVQRARQSIQTIARTTVSGPSTGTAAVGVVDGFGYGGGAAAQSPTETDIFSEEEQGRLIELSQLDPTRVSAAQLDNGPQDPKTIFASDVTVDTSDRIKNAVKNVGKTRPIAFMESNVDHNINYAIEPSYGEGRNFTSAMFTQAMYGASGDLLEIDLKVKGDPFWLEPRPISITQQQRADEITLSYIQQMLDNSVNSTIADNFILLRFRTPRVFEEATGVIERFDESQTISGVYQVLSSTHTFSNGKFTQNLHCVVDPAININYLKQTLSTNAETEKIKTAAIHNNELAGINTGTTNSIPIKQPRIQTPGDEQSDNITMPGFPDINGFT